MDQMPIFALDEVFLYLDLKSACCAFPLVSRGCFQYFHRDFTCIRYLSHLLNLPKECPFTFPQFKETILQLYSNKTEHLDPIPLSGFATSGGADGERMEYWVGNLFSRTKRAYCTCENVQNVVCAAVLTNFFPYQSNPELISAKKVAAQILRKDKHYRGIIPMIEPEDSEADLTAFEETIFCGLYTQNPERMANRAIHLSESLEERASLLRNTYTTITSAQLKLQDLVQTPTKPLILEMAIDKAAAHQIDSFFSTRHVILSRKGVFTCPVETFILFVSYDFVPVDSEEFQKFHNLVNEIEVAGLEETGGLYSSHGFVEGQYVYREFQRTKANLQPVLWGKFTHRAGEELSVRLNQVFSGKYLYVLLINSENRMQEMGDPHQFTNIDVEFCGVLGSIVSFP